MFDQETEIILATMRQRLPDRPEISMKDILAADIPHPIKTFFRTDVELLLAVELNRTRKESRFAYDHPEVRHLQQQTNSLLVLHYPFEPSEFAKRLEDTLHLIINYLVRPQWTLSGILFEKDETMDVSSIREMLRYFGPYEYLHELLLHYFDEKRPGTMTRKAFTSLLWKLDGEYLRRKTGDETGRLLFPLFDFFDYPARMGGNALPVKALVRFFDDKGLTSVVHRLEGEIVQGKESLTLHDLSTILEDTRRTFGAFAVGSREDEHARPAESLQIPAVVNPPDPPPSPLPAEAPPVIVDGEPPAAVQEAFDIDEGERRKFIRKIFRHDESAFDSTMLTLSRTPSWKKASALIDEIFINNDVDPYSSEARRFTEIMYRRYITPR